MLRTQHNFSCGDKYKPLAAHVNKLQDENKEQDHEAVLLGFLKS